MLVDHKRERIAAQIEAVKARHAYLDARRWASPAALDLKRRKMLQTEEWYFLMVEREAALA